MHAHRADVGNVCDVVTRQLPLNIKIPVIAGSVGEMSVEYHDTLRERAIGNGNRWRLGWDLGGKRTRAQKIVNCIEGIGVVFRLKGRIGTHISECIPKCSVVENAESGADGSLPVFPWVPGKSDAGLDILVVGLIQGVA